MINIECKVHMLEPTEQYKRERGGHFFGEFMRTKFTKNS